MGMITVRAPSGELISVRIAGDEPTEEEMNAISSSLSEQQTTSDTEPQPTKEPVAEQDTDYETGVQSKMFRYNFSRGDNPREKKSQLMRMGVPEEGILQDDQGRFILDLNNIPQDIKDRYGLKSRKGFTKMSVDEEGFTFRDVIDLGGEAGTPILFGTVAALAATGVGIPWAMAIVGGASALGYVADEAFEYAQGVRDETLEGDAKNVAFELLAGGLGEGGGRLIARGLGRLFKGPGNAEANAAREVAREILGGQVDPVTGKLVRGAPTVRSINMAPLFGRAQAFYEGVFPNARVATQNAKYLQISYLNLLREAGLPDRQAAKTSEEFLAALKTDIKKMYSGPEEIARRANETLKNTVEKEINSLIKRFGSDDFVGGEAAVRGVEVAKRAFDESADEMYTLANSLLGEKAILPTAGLKRKLNNLADASVVTGQAIKESSLGKVISGLDDKVTVDTMNSIRTALREASYDPSLLGSPDKAILGLLKKSVDDTMINAEASFLEAISRSAGSSPRGPGGRFISAKAIKEQKAGFESLREANEFYAKGMERFQTLFAESLTAGSRRGGRLADPEAILDDVIVPNRAKLLSDLLKATRPELGLGTKAAPQSFIDIVPDVSIKLEDGVVKNLKSIVSENPNDSLGKFYQDKFAREVDLAAEVSAARAAGDNYSESIRSSLARRWMEKTINAPDTTNIFGRTDPLKVAAKIRELGSTAPVLFGKEYQPIMKSLSQLSLLGDDISAAELRSLAGKPITEQLEAISQMTKQVDDIKGLPFMRSLESAAASGEVDKVINLVMRNKDTIRQAKQFLGANSETMNAVKDEILARAIGSLGDESSTVVRKGLFGKQQRTVSPEFVKAVMSGKQHDKIMKVLDGMGRDNMELLFGKEFVDRMQDFARRAEAVSMRPLANLGGLEVASLARSLTMGAMFVKPLQILGTLAGLRTMGAILRSRPYTSLISRPTGDVKTIRNLERALGVASGLAVRSISDATGNVMEEQDKTVNRRVQNIREGRYLGARSGAIPVDTSLRPALPMPTFDQQTGTGRLTASSVERERMFRQLAGLESR
jgi:hypothetical protein